MKTWLALAFLVALGSFAYAAMLGKRELPR